jgi:hypothetical protein
MMLTREYDDNEAGGPDSALSLSVPKELNGPWRLFRISTPER